MSSSPLPDDAVRLTVAFLDRLSKLTTRPEPPPEAGGVWAEATAADARSALPGDGAECRYCPICQAIAVLRGRRDAAEAARETVAAVGEVLLAAVEALSRQGGGGGHAHPSPGPAGPAHRVETIDLDD